MRIRAPFYGALGGGVLLIGVGIIFLFKLRFFPTILAVLGASSIVAGLATGRGWYGLQSGLWLIGLFLLFHFNILFPGILILLGISAFLGALTRPAPNADTGEEEKPS